MKSIWSESAERLHFEVLNNNINTDVLIIGGGMAGLLCAYMLKKEGVDCVLVEAKKICDGTTKNTTAKITLQHGLICSKLIKQYGHEKARLYLEANIKACEEYAHLCSKFNCDYEVKNSYVYSTDSKAKLEKEIEALKSLGLCAEFCESVNLPVKTKGAVCIKNQAQFNPLKFAFSIAKDLPIYENTKVLELMPHKAVTKHGEIVFKKAIVATHFPMLNKHGSYFIKLYQNRSYVIALENAPYVNGMYVDNSDNGFSFRNYGKLLLVGGGSHRTGKNKGKLKELQDFALSVYPNAKFSAVWAAQDCMTLDSVPYIGNYSKSTPDLYVATGFNKWGMSSSMVSAMIIRDMIKGENNKYAHVFSPSRSIMHPQLAINTFESLTGLLTPSAPRCPHLGCALKYNKEEHSWDCPCHGSRFSESGELIENPATDDKRM